MPFGRTRVFLGATIIAMTSLVAAAGAAGQNSAPANAPEHVPMSEEAFKDIRVLKGIPVDTFFDTMGMFANSLGNDCTYCHSPKAYYDKAAFAEQTPLMNRARGMVAMMNAINNMYFKGDPRVTCFTCHRGNESPASEPNIMLQYSAPTDDPNVRSFFPDTSFTADSVFDQYEKALGGADRLARFTSFVGKGTYAGFDTAKNKIAVDVYGRVQGPGGGPALDTVIHMFNGDSVRTFDGQNGWIAGPDTPLPLVTLTTGNLDRARIEAMMPFGTQLRKTFPEWRTARASMDDKEVRVVQGVRDGQVLANFYFDNNGYLVRFIRWNRTPVTWVPTHIDLSDYRDVAGIKFPFKKTVTQTFQQATIELSDVQANVDVPASRFAKPKPGR